MVNSTKRRPPDHGWSSWGRGGFTMVEVIVAIVVLAFGLLGMAATTAIVVRQVTLADMATERAAALQAAVERLRALPYDSVQSGSRTEGRFSVQWRVTAPRNHYKILEVVTTGPGLARGSGGFPVLSANVKDTLTYRIIRP